MDSPVMGFWLVLQYQVLNCIVENGSDPFRKFLVTPITNMPLLYSGYTYLPGLYCSMQGPVLGKTPDVFSPSAARIAFSSTM